MECVSATLNTNRDIHVTYYELSVLLHMNGWHQRKSHEDYFYIISTYWRCLDIEMISVLLALCMGNPLITSEQVMQNFMFSFLYTRTDHWIIGGVASDLSVSCQFSSMCTYTINSLNNGLALKSEFLQLIAVNIDAPMTQKFFFPSLGQCDF